MFRKVIQWPDLSLKQKSTPLTKEDYGPIVDDLLDTFNVTGGLGLAAPQIGIYRRVIVVNPSHLDFEDGESLVMINPVLTLSGEMWQSEEACFSVPFVMERVPRYSQCKVVFYNEKWEERWFNLKGLAAACIQHEVDHLDGVLYLDKLSRLKRQLLTKKIKKEMKRISRLRKETTADFERDHAELQMVYDDKKSKTTHSKKRKPKPRRKHKRSKR